MPFVPETTINGTYGELYLNDKFLVTVQRFEARVTVDRDEIRMVGQRGIGYKGKGVSGTGTISQFKVVSDFLQTISNPMVNPRQRQPVFTLFMKVDDPEAIGAEWVRLSGVKFWETVFGFQINELMMEDVPFTFQVFELVKPIAGDPTQVPPVRA